MPESTDTPNDSVLKPAETMGFDKEIIVQAHDRSDRKLPAMSSREIADLVGARHDNVRRTVERLSERGVIALPPLEEKPTDGRPTLEYVFAGEKGKRDSIVVVAQLSPEFTARLVDRWQELETRMPRPAALSRMDLIRLAFDAEQELEAEREKTAALSYEVQEAAPKVAFHDAVAVAVNAISIAEFAKMLGTGQNRLFRALRDKGVLANDNKPYQRLVDRQYFRVIERQYADRNGEQHVYARTLVTGKGQAYIQRLLAA